MKIKDLPEYSLAVKKMLLLTKSVQMERLRCARHIVESALWIKKAYPEDAAQWLRLEDALRDVLDDAGARVDWFATKGAK